VRGANLLLIGALAAALAGCGSTAGHRLPRSPAAMQLEREDLTAVGHALASAEGSVAPEVAATRAAWREIANGLPAHSAAIARPPIAAAAAAAARVRVPALLEEPQAASITGPGAGLASLFRNYSALTTRGWQLLGASIEEIEHGSPLAASFARANSALYIESVYDGHFDLAQVAKALHMAYEMLGGPSAFAGKLSQAQVNALESTYSEATDRLHPHVGVRLGS